MSRWKVVSIVLVLGLGIGGIVPIATAWWYTQRSVGSMLNFAQAEPVLAEKATPAPKTVYHFEIKQGILSVVEGNLGLKGQVIATGLSVRAWPKEILDSANKMEFYSLDEVQSFFDTINESL